MQVQEKLQEQKKVAEERQIEITKYISDLESANSNIAKMKDEAEVSQKLVNELKENEIKLYDQIKILEKETTERKEKERHQHGVNTVSWPLMILHGAGGRNTIHQQVLMMMSGIQMNKVNFVSYVLFDKKSVLYKI